MGSTTIGNMKIWLQNLLPQHTVSRLAGLLGNARTPWLKNWLIKQFIDHFDVDMTTAVEPDYRNFACFNDFFTRALKPDARPLPTDERLLISPVDGGIYQFGQVEAGCLLQAKGHHYDVLGLLGGDADRAEQFAGGAYLTAYLSPKDYHRIHMPCAGRLQEMVHVPGRLFSVNPYTVEHCPRLFARNERVISYFATEHGLVAMIAVGAIIVGSVATRWHGVVTPPTGREIRQWSYQDQRIQFQRGDEMGHFCAGSTVIMLFQEGQIEWDSTLQPMQPLKMGQPLAKLL